jgi:uncharacterized protein YcfJ
MNREAYDEIIKQCRDISIKKNNDYGCDTMMKFMEKGLVVRMNDKMERLINLVWNDVDGQVVDEKIEDTALDMVNYSIYLVMMLQKRLTKD